VEQSKAQESVWRLVTFGRLVFGLLRAQDSGFIHGLGIRLVIFGRFVVGFWGIQEFWWFRD
jgi:hypothetical protein